MKIRFNSTILKPCLFLAVAFLIQVLQGCKSPRSYYTNVPEAKSSSSPRVALVAGDIIEIKFFYTPQLNETQTVRPDGKISLQLVGEVEAQGLTPSELREELLKLYAKHLREPEVAVIVRSFFNNRVFVGGEVITPGIVEMPGKLTVMEAIMQAGGFDMQEAELRNVIVIRHKDGQRYGYSLNLKPILDGGETKPFYLEPQDIVYVTRTEIAKVDQWVDQHINKLIPRTGFTFSRRLGQSTVGIDTSSRY